jgi:hypothetical protein
MASERCIHGLDARFCANCNRVRQRGATTRKPATDSVALPEILRCLNDLGVRATYGAVAELSGIPANFLGGHLGERRAEASWVVSSDTGLPTGYTETDWHPSLFANTEVIRTATELAMRLSVWRAGHRTGGDPAVGS